MWRSSCINDPESLVLARERLTKAQIVWKGLLRPRCLLAAGAAQDGCEGGGCEYLGTAPWDFHRLCACNIIGNAGTCNGSRSAGAIFGRFWPVVSRGGFGGFFRVTTRVAAAGVIRAGWGVDAAQNPCENASGMASGARARGGWHRRLRPRLLLQTP